DGNGQIELVNAEIFMNRLGGFNSAISIYVSCRDGKSVGSKVVAERAKKMIGKKREYNLLLYNCHQFSSGCLTGRFDNPDNFLTFLKTTAGKTLNANEWRVWDR
ncbi:MAG: lecithin retinol acyltransferase family protein, partial [Comamonadaceae bacterium]|nr:lecithin retinol acyltransferase family protein [Comamonadaceae bacterium]